MKDDREEFRRRQRQRALQMGEDEAIVALATQLFTLSDRYDYSYQWNWLGVPIIQVPADVVVLQEIIWETRPQVIIETGVARGGSVIFLASILQLLGEGLVVGVDIDIRPHNRETIENHPLGERIALVDGSSTESSTLAAVQDLTGTAERIMVVLDSNHTHDHVEAELKAYAPLVTPGQFLVVADTVIEEIEPQTHRERPWGPGNNPGTALEAWLRSNSDFEADPYYNAKLLVTSSRGGYVRRRSS